MKKTVLLLLLSLAFLYAEAQDFDTFASAIQINNVNYNLKGTSIGIENLEGNNLGTFFVDEGTLEINGGQMYTYKNNGANVCGGSLNYRVYPTGANAEDFNIVSTTLSYDSELTNPGDQRWVTAPMNIDLTNMAGGEYVLDVYIDFQGGNTFNTCDITKFDSNGGNNYKATFNINNVSVTPLMPTANEMVTVTLFSKYSDLEGEAVYFHSGVSLNPNDATAFSKAVGNWGQDDGVGLMTPDTTDPNIYTIQLNSINDYYTLLNQSPFGLNFLFRSADGSKRVDNNGANYNVLLNAGNFMVLGTPESSLELVEINSTYSIKASAYNNNLSTSQNADWVLLEDGIQIDAQNNIASYSFNTTLTTTDTKQYTLTATFPNSAVRTESFSLSGYNSPSNSPMPSGLQPGINYVDGSDTTAFLVLHTPTSTNFKKGDGTISGSNTTTAKNVVHVIGDFNNWEVNPSYQMNKDGDFWWIELTGLIPGQLYVFQYLVDGKIRIGDPYTNQVSDNEDRFISESIYPNLPTYPADKFQGVSPLQTRASVLQTAQESYDWQVTNFVPKPINELNIYELHFRDFTEEGTYAAATERLDYIKNLGINAIHVMPVSEFEGNSSWGYNPNYYFAADKAYGPQNELKRFIDEAHKRNIAVFNDIVLNHTFGSNPMVQLYWDEANFRPQVDNPWFNAEHRAVYNTAGHWGNDWNHESEHTQAFIDRVLDYWLNEFNFDGFRFDFTKGFTQTAQNPFDEWASNPDPDRQQLLFRMIDNMRAAKPGSIAIFEHLAVPSEDKILADYGILMWSGVGHHNQVKNFNLGFNTDNIDIFSSGVFNSSQWNFNFANLISYAESHDEQRQAYEMFQYGRDVSSITNEAQRIEAGVERLKGGLAFNLMFPGPRMIWQFQELAYDYDINFNGRTGEKPVQWDYFENDDRRELYTLTGQLLESRNNYNWYANGVDYTNLGNGTDYSVKRMSMSDNNGNHIIILSNPYASGVTASAIPNYSINGTWYQNNGDTNYINTPFIVNSSNDTYTLQPGQTMVLTNFQLNVPNQNIAVVPSVSNNSISVSCIDANVNLNDFVTSTTPVNATLQWRYTVGGERLDANNAPYILTDPNGNTTNDVADDNRYYPFYYYATTNESGPVGESITIDFQDCTLSVSDINEGLNAVVYPNPVNNTLYIKTDNATQGVIYTLNGVKLLEQTLNNSNNPIDISKLKSGIYILNILGNGVNQQFKVVKN